MAGPCPAPGKRPRCLQTLLGASFFVVLGMVLKRFLLDFSREKRVREREKHRHENGTSIHHPLNPFPTRDEPQNLGMCPDGDQGSNPQPFSAWDDTQPAEPQRPGPESYCRSGASPPSLTAYHSPSFIATLLPQQLSFQSLVSRVHSPLRASAAPSACTALPQIQAWLLPTGHVSAPTPPPHPGSAMSSAGRSTGPS